MKHNFFESYFFRVHWSSCFVVFAPAAMLLLFCFSRKSNVLGLGAAVAFIAILTAFAGCTYVRSKMFDTDEQRISKYAASLLMPENSELNMVSKNRYYRVLAETDPSFAGFRNPDNSEEFLQNCASAVDFLRKRLGDSPALAEERVSCDFYKALYVNRWLGVIMCVSSAILVFLFAATIRLLTIGNSLAFIADALLLIFWLFRVNKKGIEFAEKRYAKALISGIDLLKTK